MSNESITKEFLEKENVVSLYKTILSKKFSNKSLPKDTKQNILDNIIKQMKTTYKTLDKSKINQKNLSSVRSQFNNICINETMKVFNDDYFNNSDFVNSNRKSERDFALKKQVSFMERPSTLNNFNDNNSFHSQFQNNDSIEFNNKFNNDKSIDERMKELEDNRRETNPKSTIPDFLRPKNSSNNPEPRSPPQEQNNSNNQTNDTPQLPGNNFLPFNSNDSYQAFGNSNENSIKPLYETKAYDEKLSLNDRLSQLEKDREQANNILASQPNHTRPTIEQSNNVPNNNLQSNMPNNNLQSNMPSNNMPSNNMLSYDPIPPGNNLQSNNMPSYDPTPTNNNNIPNNNIPSNNMPSYDPTPPNDNNIPSNSIPSYDPMPPSDNNIPSNNMTSYDPTPPNDNNIPSNSIPSYDPIPPSDNNITSSNNLPSNNINNENSNYANNNLLEILFEQINSLRNDLKELSERVTNNERYQLENTDNNEVSMSRNKLTKLQLEINKVNSKYQYKFNKLKNVIDIKLISYSLPTPLYNMNNHELKYFFNDGESITENIIHIEKGYYSVQSLINTLNKNNNLEFIQEPNRKMRIMLKVPDDINKDSIIVNKSFKLMENDFTKKIGFYIDKKFVSNLLSNNVLDLRLPTKLYLYITNIQKDHPFAILNFNGSSIGNVSFKEPIDLDSLNLLFVSPDNEKYEFNNMPYNLSFQISIIEKDSVTLSNSI